MCIKHLYQRSITYKGKKVKAWYYWYRDKTGKQIRKTCGINGKPCLLKREAEAFIANLDDEELLREKITLQEFAGEMFKPGSKYLLKLENKEMPIVESTRYYKEHTLGIFLEKFGKYQPEDISSVDVENWLLELPYSNAYKNHIVSVVDEVYKELYAYRIIRNRPIFDRYRRNTKEKGILTLAEIKKLFPADDNEIIQIWKINNEPDAVTYNFAVMIYTILTTGMRSCEIRALKWDQFVQDDVLLLNCMIDSTGERVDHLKKGNSKKKKWRVVILPDRTLRMIQKLKLMRNYESEFIFEFKGNCCKTSYLLDHFKIVLEKNGIDYKGRNLVIHSLRFTYNTLMKPEITGEDLRLMVGHASEAMTDYYDKSQALDHIPKLLKNKDVINSIFN